MPRPNNMSLQERPLTSLRWLIVFALAMCAVVGLSNYWVQFPVRLRIGEWNLADLLTFGAFTYPVAFLVSDLANRRLGPKSARAVALAGFALAVILSVFLATPRIAMASGTAFLVAQFCDIGIFDRLRHQTWWRAPLISTLIGSSLDTILFFGLAFSATASAWLGAGDAFAVEAAPLLGLFSPEVPRWVSWAIGDFAIKLLVGAALLVPYRLIAKSFSVSGSVAAELR